MKPLEAYEDRLSGGRRRIRRHNQVAGKGKCFEADINSYLMWI